MNKRHFLAAAAVALTAAAGSATQASETIVPEATQVPAITVNSNGELEYAPEFQGIAANDRVAEEEGSILTQTGCCDACGAPGCACSN